MQSLCSTRHAAASGCSSAVMAQRYQRSAVPRRQPGNRLQLPRSAGTASGGQTDGSDCCAHRAPHRRPSRSRPLAQADTVAATVLSVSARDRVFPHSELLVQIDPPALSRLGWDPSFAAAFAAAAPASTTPARVAMVSSQRLTVIGDWGSGRSPSPALSARPRPRAASPPATGWPSTTRWPCSCCPAAVCCSAAPPVARRPPRRWRPTSTRCSSRCRSASRSACAASSAAWPWPGRAVRDPLSCSPRPTSATTCPATSPPPARRPAGGGHRASARRALAWTRCAPPSPRGRRAPSSDRAARASRR